jgi:hypothetical protein
MKAFEFQTPDGTVGRFEPVGNDKFRITSYAPTGNADYSGQGPIAGDTDGALEVPTMHFGPPKPKVAKSAPAKQESGNRHWDPPMTLNEEPLALPSLGY